MESKSIKLMSIRIFSNIPGRPCNMDNSSTFVLKVCKGYPSLQIILDFCYNSTIIDNLIPQNLPLLTYLPPT